MVEAQSMEGRRQILRDQQDRIDQQFGTINNTSSTLVLDVLTPLVNAQAISMRILAESVEAVSTNLERARRNEDRNYRNT